MKELYRISPPYRQQWVPENAIRGVEPIRMMNQLRHVFNLVEDIPDAVAPQKRHSSLHDECEDGVSIPLISSDGRVVNLIQ